MPSFDVLDPNTTILGHYFLEASAGTGKTFAIENLVPRLLLESKEPITIDQILVVTFTRAATRELKARIYKNLIKVSLALQEGKGGPKYLEPFFLGGKEFLQTARRKIEEACFCFEKTQIFTLHGFALSILQEFSFEADFFSISSLDDLDSHEKIQKYIQDFLRVGIKEELLSPSQMKKICSQKHIDKNSRNLSKVLIQLLEKGQPIRLYETAKQRFNRWNELLASFPRVSKEDLLHDLRLISPRSLQSKKWAAQIEFLFPLIEKRFFSFEEWDALLEEKELILEGLSYPDKPKNYRNPGFFEKLKELVPLYKEATDPSVLLLQLANAAKAHYEKGKNDKACFAPDDFIEKLKNSLESPFFIQKVREKYKGLIIDEFQDTDANQWTIFQTLFFSKKEACQTIYLVGDPKQSIYGFRNADVYIYLKAKSLFAEENHFHLDTNFRSHPQLVEALNTLFSFDLPENWMTLPLSSESLSVRQVAYKSVHDSSFQDEEKGRIHFFLQEEKQERSKQWPSKETEETRLIPYMVEEILRLKTEKGLCFSQIAILVKDRYQADRVQSIFSTYNIPCRMQKKLDVTGRSFDAIKDLIICLNDPSDISSLKRFLGGPLMGYTQEEIQGSWDNFFLQKAREDFTCFVREVRYKGFGSFFVNFLASPAKEKEKSVAEALFSRGQAELYFEIRQLCQILLEHCPEGFYEAKELLVFLEELKEKNPQDILRQFSEQEEDQVHVMTLHKSKGLEFDIVFALGLGSRFSGKENYFSVRLGEGRELAALNLEEESTLHSQESDAEKLRQLYVALTRAKERVYIPYVYSAKEKDVTQGTASPIELFLGGKGLSSYIFLDVYQQIQTLSLDKILLYLTSLEKKASISYELLSFSSPKSIFEKNEDFKKPIPISFSFEDSFCLSFSSLTEGKKKEVGFFPSEVFDYDLPLGAETGTLIHKILEILCKNGLHQESSFLISPIVTKCCKGTILEGKEEKVLKIIITSLHTPITTPWGNIVLAEVPSSDMQLEVEFLYPVGSSLLKGFMDLVFRFRGRYFLLDWKTNALGLLDEDYTEERMKECMEENQYGLQAAIYALAIKKYLSLVDSRPFRQIFGGAIYFFLRGKKPLFFSPELPLTKAIEKEALVWKEE